MNPCDGYVDVFFFFTLVTGPRRSLSLKMSDTRVYEPQIRARLYVDVDVTHRTVAKTTFRQNREFSNLTRTNALPLGVGSEGRRGRWGTPTMALHTRIQQRE